MPAWILATIAAAFLQNLRFALQRHLKVTSLSTLGATWARFAFAAPLAALAVVVYQKASGQDWPVAARDFWAFVTAGALAQMLATACVVALFARRNFFVGITLKKSEVILTALIGLILLGEDVSTSALVAIAVGFTGVLALADPPAQSGLPWHDRIFNAASGYGLASGLFFGISAVCYRGATLALDGGDAPLRAATALAAATAIQTLTLGAWIAWREPGQIRRILVSWRVSAPMGAASMLGSLCWFTAFALQTAAYVKAVGQVELVFTFLFSTLWLRERPARSELVGIALILVSLGVILTAELRH